MHKKINRELSRHPEFNSGSQEKTAQRVRGDMVIGHPERSEGSQSKTIRLYDYKSLSTLQKVIHRETEKLPKERNELIDLSSYRPNDLIKKAAFTLAEVLITLAIIGVVAALTIPGLIQNHNEKAWSTAKDLWEKKLTETVRRMNTDGVMTGHSTTESFMDSFKQYVKVIKSCDNSDINKCYSPKVLTTGKPGEEIEVTTSDLKTAQSMGIKDWGTNTESFVIADGTTVILAYNPECPYADPIEDTGSQLSCLGMMIDVNGKKGPNRVNEDIKITEGVTFSTCDNPIGDMCWSTDFAATRAADTTEGGEYASRDPLYQTKNNYWVGAMLSCEDKGMKLPTMAQLASLASTIYGQTIEPYKDYNNGLSIQKGYENALTFGYTYWSSEQYPSSDYPAYLRSFNTTSSYWYNYGKSTSGVRAVCIGK